MILDYPIVPNPPSTKTACPPINRNPIHHSIPLSPRRRQPQRFAPSSYGYSLMPETARCLQYLLVEFLVSGIAVSSGLPTLLVQSLISGCSLKRNNNSRGGSAARTVGLGLFIHEYHLHKMPRLGSVLLDHLQVGVTWPHQFLRETPRRYLVGSNQYRPRRDCPTMMRNCSMPHK